MHGWMEFRSPLVDASDAFCLTWSYSITGNAKIELFLETRSEVISSDAISNYE